MTAEDLKNSILQLAVRGKLVEQRPEEGTAEELYQRIQEERQRLVRAEKIKKERPLSEIAEGEKPFDIPENWKWVRLGSIYSVFMGQSPAGTAVSEREKGMEFHQGKIYFSDITIGKSPLSTTQITKVAPINSLLLCVRAPVGKVNITDRDICIGRGLASLVSYVQMPIMYTFFMMQTLEHDFIRQATGSTFKAISSTIIEKQLIPLPPLAEQKRIAAKIEKLLPLVAEYAETEQKLSTLNAEFPDMLRQSILQQGIQGRLSERDPADEPANQLIKRIRHIKDALLRAGKIRKEKSLPPISDGEKPFEIPDTWEWVRLSDICNISDGTHQTPRYVESGVPFISAQNVKPYRFIPEVHRNVSREDYLEYNKVVAPAKGDILMTRVGAGIGEAAIIDRDFEFSIYVSLTLIKRYGNELNMEYLLHVLNSPQGRALAAKRTLGKGASQGNLNLAFIREFVVPIPPLAEQQRIVERVEELLAVCEQLK